MNPLQLQRWFTLSQLDRVGWTTSQKLLDHFKTIDEVFEASEADLLATGASEALCQRLLAAEPVNIDHELWNNEDAVLWICNLNWKEYQEYEIPFFVHFSINDIDGPSLKNLNKRTIRKYGRVYNADHLDHIYQAIQKLTSERNPNKECVICMDGAKEYACVPCGHLCLCVQCKDRFDYQCPLCRIECDYVIKVYQ